MMRAVKQVMQIETLVQLVREASDFRPCCPACNAHVPGGELAVCVPCAYTWFRQTVFEALTEYTPNAMVVTDNGKRFRVWIRFPGERHEERLSFFHCANKQLVWTAISDACSEAAARLGWRALGR